MPSPKSYSIPFKSIEQRLTLYRCALLSGVIRLKKKNTSLKQVCKFCLFQAREIMFNKREFKIKKPTQKFLKGGKGGERKGEKEKTEMGKERE